MKTDKLEPWMSMTQVSSYVIVAKANSKKKKRLNNEKQKAKICQGLNT